MRARRSFWSVRSMHLVVLAACTLVFTAQSVSEFGHALLHASPGARIHDEATHPDAASHLDQEEHRDLDECVACIHTSKRFASFQGSSSSLAGSDSIAPVVVLAASHNAARVSGPPRAPPA